jgi:hypothetical protein
MPQETSLVLISVRGSINIHYIINDSAPHHEGIRLNGGITSTFKKLYFNLVQLWCNNPWQVTHILNTCRTHAIYDITVVFDSSMRLCQCLFHTILCHKSDSVNCVIAFTYVQTVALFKCLFHTHYFGKEINSQQLYTVGLMRWCFLTEFCTSSI